MHAAWEKTLMMLNPYLSFSYGTSGSQNHRNTEVEKDLQGHQVLPSTQHCLVQHQTMSPSATTAESLTVLSICTSLPQYPVSQNFLAFIVQNPHPSDRHGRKARLT